MTLNLNKHVSGWLASEVVGAEPVLYVCPMRHCGRVFREPGVCRNSAKHYVGGASTTSEPVPLVRYERADEQGKALLPAFRGDANSFDRELDRAGIALALETAGLEPRIFEVELRFDRSTNLRDRYLRVFAMLARRRNERERFEREAS